MTNSGSLTVEAVTVDGGPAYANGLVVTGNGTGLLPGVDDVFTFTNDGGTILVRQSQDGGGTWQHGVAVDVSAAPNPSIINLVGNGDIYGDIEIADTDESTLPVARPTSMASSTLRRSRVTTAPTAPPECSMTRCSTAALPVSAH